MSPAKKSITWQETRKGRQHLAQETGAIIKDWGGKLPFACVYPNTYYIGMSNLGLQAIYSLLNSRADVLCERAFWDKQSQAAGTLPLSVESGRPLNDFAILAFSLNYELDYFNVAPILAASGLPVFSAERDESHPLVIAGGPCISANPMPVAPFFDALCIGEAEVLLPGMVPALAESSDLGRAHLLDSLARLPGIYVPSGAHQQRVVRQWARDLDAFPVHSVVLTSDTELNDMYLIEVQRGCAHGCRFCLVSNTFSPLRFRSAASILAQAREGLRSRRRIGLVGPAVTDHPQTEEILAGLLEMGAMISLSSLRLTSFTEEISQMLVRGGLRSIALAPEAGSACLRTAINKGFDEERILRAVTVAASSGITQIKLYFMVGLPGETDSDIQAIVSLTIAAQNAAEKHGSNTRLSVNISPFVPKAGTPFQWLPMAPVSLLEERISCLKSQLSGRGVEVKHESPQWSEIQAVLARGDERLARILAETRRTSLPDWRKAAARFDLDVDYLAHRKWETSEPLPWGFIDSGVQTPGLQAEMEKALTGQ